MNRLRFGAILFNCKELGFYLSHRIILTVDGEGAVHAMAMRDFLPCKVFAVKGVAVSFPCALTAAAADNGKFQNSLDFVKKMLELPEKATWEDLNTMMKNWHGAELEEFAIPCPEQEDNSLGENGRPF